MIYFLIPLYNEEKNIFNLHADLVSIKVNEDCTFVFSDDGSSDQSISLIHQFFKGTRFVILGDGINRGPGAAFNVGFEWILSDSSSETDRIISMEADCTSDLSILPVMLVLSSMNYDLVLASVYAQGGGFDKTSIFRKLTSAIANFLFRFLFNVQVLTLSSFYRVYSISIIRRIKEKYGKIISEAGFICMLEILMKGIQENASVIEVPMKLHSSKRQGQSKMKVVKTTVQYFAFLVRQKLMNR